MSQPVAGRSPSTGRGGASPGWRARRGASAIGAAILVASSLLVPASVGAANANPVAHVDQVYGDEDTVLTGNILANDTDPDGGTLSVASYNAVTYGVLVVTAAGDLTYTPPPDYSGGYHHVLALRTARAASPSASSRCMSSRSTTLPTRPTTRSMRPRTPPRPSRPASCSPTTPTSTATRS